MEKIIVLKAIKESTSDFEAVEKRIKELFKTEIYLPLMREFGEGSRTLQNATSKPNGALIDAIFSGRVTFYRGTFSGKLNASITRDLKKIGAVWDYKTGKFKLPQASLPMSVRAVVAASESRFNDKIAKLDKHLSEIVPEQLADKLKISKLFDRTLWKTEKEFQGSVKNITVAPQLTSERRARIADEWQNNMKLWIKDFTEKEIKQLRANMQKVVFSGNRQESAVKTIQESYGVSANKAKFLARQETALLMTKFKETRYADSGIHEYTWHNVTGSKLHPVRPRHKALGEAREKDGSKKIFRFDQPPVTSEPDQPERRNNPQQDYNCRCFARPVVRFRK